VSDVLRPSSDNQSSLNNFLHHDIHEDLFCFPRSPPHIRSASLNAHPPRRRQGLRTLCLGNDVSSKLTRNHSASEYIILTKLLRLPCSRVHLLEVPRWIGTLLPVTTLLFDSLVPTCKRYDLPHFPTLQLTISIAALILVSAPPMVPPL
jgi:hypothetical protein